MQAGVTAAVLLAVMSSSALAEWGVDTAIMGIDMVVKDSPNNTDHLHYNRANLGENAQFHLTFLAGGVTDKDKCRATPSDPWEYVTRTLIVDENDTTGIAKYVSWTKSHGSITAGGLYTPPVTTHSTITVKGWVDDVDDTEVEGRNDTIVGVQYAGTLRSYKVGVKVMPGSHEVWEDSAGADPATWASYSDADDLEVFKQTTGRYADGFSSDDGSWALSDASWEAITLPADCTIVGNIAFAPRIDVAGTLERKAQGDCDDDVTTSIVTTALAVAGKVTPPPIAFVAAATNIVISFVSGDGCNINMAVVGAAAIEFVDASTVDEPKANYDTENESWHLVDTVSLDSLSVSGEIKLKPGDDIRGDASVKTEVSIRDTEWLNWAGAEIEGASGDTFHLKYGTSRPTYDATP